MLLTKEQLLALLRSRAFQLIVIAFVVAAFLPLLIPYIFLNVLTLIIIFAIYASSWNFLANSGQGSLGHAVFLGIGGFGSAIIGGSISGAIAGFLGASHMSVGVVSLFIQVSTLLIGALVSAGIGLLIGLVCVRLKAWYLAMVTFGFSVIAESLSSQFDSFTHGINGFAPTILVSPGFPFYLLVLSFAVVSVAVMFTIMRSRLGLTFRAIRENEAEAKMVGINTAKYKLLAFVLSTFFAGLAGGLYVYFIGFVDNSIFRPEYSFSPLIMSVIGGLGTVAGPIIGAAIYTSIVPPTGLLSLQSVTDSLQNALGHFFPGVSNVGPPLGFLFIGVFLVLIVIFAPKGVVSITPKAKKLFSRFLSEGERK